ncbi:hypothetical protein [Maricaulis maris]|uniref:VCBS repeat-containing protein n=1 Tax=Maricaulis maris TaxID=74318 RepID=A0A495DKE6_9PROT|nr:hypothetical protein [Maricaulis maris]RKR03042.1 hypothetical protein C7435_0990 [Maricaulis maris]
MMTMITTMATRMTPMMTRLAAVLVAGLVATAAHGQDFTHADDGMPWCDTLEIGSAGAVDCALMPADVLLNFAYETGEWESILSFTQHDPMTGELLDASDPLTIESVVSAPALRDINEDGAPELFIPYITGNVNTYYYVWQADEAGIYYPSGELGGFGVDAFELRDGLVITTTRDSAATYYETAQLLDVDGFVPIYEMLINAADGSCTITDGSGVMARGLDAATITADCEAGLAN